ncbi:hypothetical protein C8R45DRAFT_940062 [Mycena sanguinolenta]|nr:hypothetical protein C8R45DRAFT_940062 [Mycena sanguinolenta]
MTKRLRNGDSGVKLEFQGHRRNKEHPRRDRLPWRATVRRRPAQPPAYVSPSPSPETPAYAPAYVRAQRQPKPQPSTEAEEDDVPLARGSSTRGSRAPQRVRAFVTQTLPGTRTRAGSNVKKTGVPPSSTSATNMLANAARLTGSTASPERIDLPPSRFICVLLGGQIDTQAGAGTAALVRLLNIRALSVACTRGARRRLRRRCPDIPEHRHSGAVLYTDASSDARSPGSRAAREF